MKIYSIFDDFAEEACSLLDNNHINLTVHPAGVPRPSKDMIHSILEKYDGIIIGTSQKITEDMFDNIYTPRIIATASVGLDHIKIPVKKKDLVTVINTPTANAQSVAEYTFGCALSCCKRLTEGCNLYKSGKNNKLLSQKPDDLNGKTLGVIGAGNISKRIMEYGLFFGMTVLCWTAHPLKHPEVPKIGAVFTELDHLIKASDIISVNLPNNTGTVNLISETLIRQMEPNCIFISVSRLETIDYSALFRRALSDPNFYVCLDLDVDQRVIKELPDIPNVIVTPHIAGGTKATRKRMFMELAHKIVTIHTQSKSSILT